MTHLVYSRMCRRIPNGSIVSIRSSSRSGGAATVEFALAFALVIWPLMAAIFELSQISLARHALSFAVYEAARAESRETGSDFDTRRRLAAGLLPLLGGVTLSERTPVADVAVAMTRALGETLRADLLEHTLESVGPVGPYGVVRRLRVTYCRELFFPPVKQFLPRILTWLEDDPFDLACLLRERIPLRASAAVLGAAESAPRAAGVVGFAGDYPAVFDWSDVYDLVRVDSARARSAVVSTSSTASGSSIAMTSGSDRSRFLAP